MKCPPAIAQVLLEILHNGLLHIRSCAWQDDAETCARQADHLHNLPSLLADYSAEQLLYYWQVERAGFAIECDSRSAELIAPMWERLEKMLPTATKVAETVGER